MNNFSHRNPVLLVHGINDTGAIFEKMVLYLTSVVGLYDLDRNGDLTTKGQQVANYVAATLQTNPSI